MADREIWRISREVIVAETSTKARELAMDGPIARSWRETALPTARRFGMPVETITGPDAGIGWDDMDELIEYCCEQIWLVGDSDEVAGKLNAFNAGVGGFGTLLVIAQDWDEEPWKRSMTLLMREVLPRVNDVRQPALP